MCFLGPARQIFYGSINILMMGLLSACVPMKETFYEPVAEGGKTSGRTCHGNVGSRNRVVFQHPDVRIDISAFWERPLIEIHFSMPEGMTLIVPATQFRVKTKINSEPLTLRKLIQYQFPLTSLGTPKRTDLPTKEELVLRGKKSRVFFLTFPINIALTDEFVLTVPLLLANQKEIMIPPITWTLKTEWFVLPINC